MNREIKEHTSYFEHKEKPGFAEPEIHPSKKGETVK
jgi:hypothetical protein